VKDRIIFIVKYQKFYTTCPSKPGKSGFKLVKYKILVGRIDSTSLINYVLNYIPKTDLAIIKEALDLIASKEKNNNSS